MVARRLAMPLLVGVSYLVAALGLGPPPAVTVDADSTTVTWVAPGSYAWYLGVRPGLPIVAVTPPGGQLGYTVERADLSTVGLPVQLEVDVTNTVALVLLFLLLAIAGRRLGLPGWSVSLGLSAAAALGPLAPALGYPPALLVGLLPPAVTLAAIGGSTPDLARPRNAWLALAVIAAAFAVPVVASARPDVDWQWPLLWYVPALTVIALGSLSALPLAVRTLGTRGVTWPARFSLFVDEAFPIARASRLSASADERERLATELHDHVLPQISQALLELDADDPAGRRRLAGAVEQIRRSMTARQGIALRTAGLAAAVEADVAALDVAVDIDLEPRVVGRAPARVEQAAYRVAQLAITNAVQHASAERITVGVDEDADYVHLRVVDDGVGIDDVAARTALARGHVGLAAMRSEATEVGARIDVRSAPDEGTTVLFLWRR